MKKNKILNKNVLLLILSLLMVFNFSVYMINKKVPDNLVATCLYYIVNSPTQEDINEFQDMIVKYEETKGNLVFRFVTPDSADFEYINSKHNLTGSKTIIIGTNESTYEKFSSLPSKEELDKLVKKYGH